MSFNGIDFYTWAGENYQRSSDNDQALLRAIISRAYYGAFLCARDKANIISTDKSVHTEVSSYFSNLPKNDPLSKVGNKLFNLRTMRCKADYTIQLTFSRSNAYAGIKDAHLVLAILGYQIPTPAFYATSIVKPKDTQPEKTN